MDFGSSGTGKSFFDNELIKEALMATFDKKFGFTDAELAVVPKHEFSAEFDERMNKLMKMFGQEDDSMENITVTMPIAEYERLKAIEEGFNEHIQMFERANPDGKSANMTKELETFIKEIYY